MTKKKRSLSRGVRRGGGGGGGGGGSGGSGEPPLFQINYIHSIAWDACLACK